MRGRTSTNGRTRSWRPSRSIGRGSVRPPTARPQKVVPASAGGRPGCSRRSPTDPLDADGELGRDRRDRLTRGQVGGHDEARHGHCLRERLAQEPRLLCQDVVEVLAPARVLNVLEGATLLAEDAARGSALRSRTTTRTSGSGSRITVPSVSTGTRTGGATAPPVAVRTKPRPRSSARVRAGNAARAAGAVSATSG